VLGLGVLEQLGLGGRGDERLQAHVALCLFLRLDDGEREGRGGESKRRAASGEWRDDGDKENTKKRTLMVRADALALSWLPLPALFSFSSFFSRALADF
jgi:hypothetical protein